MGVMIDLLGDDRFFARITYFETNQVGDAAVSPSGAVTNAQALGRSQTLAILAAFRDAGRITQAQYDAQSFNWNAAIIDTESKGVELSSSPTRRRTGRSAPTTRTRPATAPTSLPKAKSSLGESFLMARAGRQRSALRALVEANINEIQTEEIDGRAVDLEQGFGSIPHKATLTTRYKFSQGRMQGAFVGGAMRLPIRRVQPNRHARSECRWHRQGLLHAQHALHGCVRRLSLPDAMAQPACERAAQWPQHLQLRPGQRGALQR
jgi:hypothetical protein